jgi:hypothetical protein
MSRAILVIFLVIFGSGLVHAQSAWCENNCKVLCTKIYGRAGASACFAQIPCANYAGKACAPSSVVNARYVVYCHGHKGVGTCR